MPKLKNILLICTNHITIDDVGKIDFKSSLKYEIINNSISKDDALYIVLDLLYETNKYDLKYEDISNKLSELINDVKKYDVSVRHKILFFKPYLMELDIILDHITGLAEKRNIKKNYIRALNAQNPSKTELKSIKKYLNKYSRENLCYILDIDSDLNFEKDKVLKNKIASKLSEISFDEKLLKDYSPGDIKKLLNSNDSNSLTNKEIIHLQNKDLLNLRVEFENRIKIRSKKEKHNKLNKNQSKKESKKPNKKDKFEKYNAWQTEEKKLRDKRNEELKIKLAEARKNKEKQNESYRIEQEKLRKVRQKQQEQKDKIKSRIAKVNTFNNKNFKDMVQSKEEYQKLYLEISNDYSDLYYKNKDVDNFIYYFSNFEVIEKLMPIAENLNEKKNLISDFFIEINNSDYLSFQKREKIIHKYKGLYEYASKLNQFPGFLVQKLFNEVQDLKRFLLYYYDLLNYSTVNNVNSSNNIELMNETYINREIDENTEFFNDIDDSNKKKAIVIDEDNVKVVAGAGAGKTFIIHKKVNYLINKGVDPKKILCLCYTRKTVEQLEDEINKGNSDNRIEDKDKKQKVKVFTFHEFCRRVIKECGLRRTSNRYLLDKVIRDYVIGMSKSPKKLAKLSEYFSYYNKPQLDDNHFTTLEKYEEYRENNKFKSLKKKFYQSTEDIETIKGENVRSIGELLIANYLFMHEIEYEYERKYPYYYFADMIYYRFFYSGAYFCLNRITVNCSNEDLINAFLDWEYDRIKYKPDFYLPEYDIYLEHFGVDKNMEASFLEGHDKEKYERLMYSKEVFHELYGTKLIKTYFYYLTEGRLLEELEAILRENKVKIGQMPKEKIVEMIINNERVKDYENFSKLVKSFINIYESKNQQKADFDEFRMKNKSSDNYTFKRQELFLNIAEEIYNNYYDEARKGDISHNHEIIMALGLIKNNVFKRKYDYIFIDEYQDINPMRCELLQELQKNSNAKLFVVGDDWQSIYRFSGSDVNLFLDFDKYFKNAETITIEENRRNPQKLINISSDFILSKGNLDEKVLKYYKEEKNPLIKPIRIIKYDKDKRRSKILKLDAVISDILEKSENSNPRILILGRNNSDIEDYVGNMLFIEQGDKKHKKIIYSEKPDLDITFMTIHQSKGLERDYVIVLNLEDKLDGFPNKIEDDPILSFVNEKEDYEYAEERRLFYVALTRAKNQVYLLHPVNNPSDFIDEISEYDGVNFDDLSYRIRSKNLYKENDLFENIVPIPTKIPCPNCGKGVITIILNNHNSEGKRTKYVRCSKRCGYNGGPYPASLEDVDYVEKCPKCRGVLVRHGDILRCCLNYHEGCKETKELKLEKDELEFDYD